LTGFEKQLAQHTFGAKAPTTMLVRAILHKYQGTMHFSKIKQPAKIYVIYQDIDADYPAYDVLEIDTFHKTHDTFGFRVQYTDAFYQMDEGVVIEKDTILTHSSNVHYDLDPEGMYGQGIMANFAHLALPYTIEDGFLVSESFNRRAQALTISKRTASWGADQVALNLWGNDEVYRPLPEPGMTIGNDGILLATRKLDPVFGAIDLSPKQLMKPDLIYDKIVRVPPGARIIDVEVISSNTEGRWQTTSDEMSVQPNQYADMNSMLAERLISHYEQIMREDRNSVIRPRLQKILTYAYADKPNDSSRRFDTSNNTNIRRLYRGHPLDEFRVEVTFENDFIHNLTTKISTLAGGKGVECHILPDEDMPRDEWGNVVDVAGYGRSVIARLIPAQPLEQFVNAASRDVTNDVRALLDEGKADKAWKHLVGYYAVTSPPTAEALSQAGKKKQQAHMDSVYKNGIYLHIPSDAEWMDIDVYDRIMKYRAPNKGHLWYKNDVGELTRTEAKVLIGGVYIQVLEKSDGKPMAVAGPRLQHHGLPAVASGPALYSTPTKEQACRLWGESEIRALVATIGGEATANLVDYTTNPNSHRAVIRSIFNAKNPSRIKELVDRNEIPLGNSRPTAFARHLLFCYGIEID